MKLRLKQAGFETYSGQMGVIFFEKGLSTTDVLPVDAVRISAVMQCEWESGETSNVAQRLLDRADEPAPILENNTGIEVPEVEKAEPQEPEQTDEQRVVEFTEEELAAIADAKGIAGLRELAEPFGIKGNSIRGLIDALVKKG